MVLHISALTDGQTTQAYDNDYDPTAPSDSCTDDEGAGDVTATGDTVDVAGEPLKTGDAKVKVIRASGAGGVASGFDDITNASNTPADADVTSYHHTDPDCVD